MSDTVEIPTVLYAQMMVEIIQDPFEVIIFYLGGQGRRVEMIARADRSDEERMAGLRKIDSLPGGYREAFIGTFWHFWYPDVFGQDADHPNADKIRDGFYEMLAQNLYGPLRAGLHKHMLRSDFISVCTFLSSDDQRLQAWQWDFTDGNTYRLPVEII